MRREDEDRIREIFWEELSSFLHEIEIEAGEPQTDGGDTETAREFLRRLFIIARSRHVNNQF